MYEAAQKRRGGGRRTTTDPARARRDATSHTAWTSGRCFPLRGRGRGPADWEERDGAAGRDSAAERLRQGSRDLHRQQYLE